MLSDECKNILLEALNRVEELSGNLYEMKLREYNTHHDYIIGNFEEKNQNKRVIICINNINYLNSLRVNEMVRARGGKDRSLPLNWDCFKELDGIYNNIKDADDAIKIFCERYDYPMAYLCPSENKIYYERASGRETFLYEIGEYTFIK